MGPPFAAALYSSTLPGSKSRAFTGPYACRVFPDKIHSVHRLSTAPWERTLANEYGDRIPGMTHRRFAPGAEDVVILPVVLTALVAKNLLQATLSILIHILDYTFPILLQLMRIPLFTARIIGDGIAALANGIVGYLPVSSAMREALREFVSRHWSWLKQKISYQAFEKAVHDAFEAGMAWVFRTCKKLTPGVALLVIAGALLWLPLSLVAATAMHAALIAKAASLPAWMQLLHPVATFIAKSKLLVLPVYPAAWPQAKKHPFVQAIFEFARQVTSLRLIRKTGYRYRQTERAAAETADGLGRAAAIVGFTDVLHILLARPRSAAASIGKALRAGTILTIEGFSRIPLIGSIVRSYEAQYGGLDQQPAETLSQQAVGFFEQWSIKFSAEYYDAKEREDAKRPAEAGRDQHSAKTSQARSPE